MPLLLTLAGAGDPDAPERLAALALRPGGDAVERAGPGELFQARQPDPRAGGEFGDPLIGTAALALGDQRLHLLLLHALDVAEPDPHLQPPAHLVAARRFDVAEHLAAVGIDRGDADAAALGLVDQRVRRVEAHRLLVQQRAEELGPVVEPQPGRLVGEQAEGGGVRLREAVAGEALDLRPDPFGHLLGDAVGGGAGEEALVVLADRLLGALAAHRPPQPLRLGGGEVGQRHHHLDHLLLEDDRPQRLLQHRLQQRVLVGDLVVGVLATQLAPLYVGMDRRRPGSGPAAPAPPGR